MRMRIYAYKLRMQWTLISERYCSRMLLHVETLSVYSFLINKFGEFCFSFKINCCISDHLLYSH